MIIWNLLVSLRAPILLNRAATLKLGLQSLLRASGGGSGPLREPAWSSQSIVAIVVPSMQVYNVIQQETWESWLETMLSKQTTNKKTLFLLASTIVPILFGTTRAVVFQVNTSTLSPRFADLYLFPKTPWASRILKHCKIRQDILWPWHGTVVLNQKKKRQVRPSAATGASPAAALPIGDATDALCSSPSYDGVLWPMKNHQPCFLAVFWACMLLIFLFFVHFLDVNKNAELLTLASSVVKIFWCGWPGAPVLVTKGWQQKLLSIGVGFCKSNWLRFGFQGPRYCGW